MPDGVWKGKQAVQDKGHAQAMVSKVSRSPSDAYLLVLQKPCQSQSIGAAHPSKCLIPSPLVSRCTDLPPLPCSSMEYHPPEPQVPAEKFGLQNVGQEELSGCVEQTA